jgi:hypothetical protein
MFWRNITNTEACFKTVFLAKWRLGSDCLGWNLDSSVTVWHTNHVNQSLKYLIHSTYIKWENFITDRGCEALNEWMHVFRKAYKTLFT